MLKAQDWRAGAGKASRGLPAMWSMLMLVAVWLVITAAGGGTAYADVPVAAGGKAVVANTDGDPIRIRRGAGTDYTQIASAREGQAVNVLEGPVTDRAGIVWFKIETPAATGWMMAQYLKGTSAPPAAAPAPEEPAAPAGPTLSGSAKVANTNGDPLRVRTLPNTSGSVIARLDPGTVVSIEGGPVTDDSGIVWYKIKSGNISGWVMAQYLAQVASGPEPVDERESPPAAQPASERSSGNGNGNGGSASSTAEQYRIWMEEARAMYPYPQTVEKMWSVMKCESGGNPNASGGGGRWLGLFQYAPGTWGGGWNPYRNESIWDAKSQIFATAKAWSIGMQSHWSCYYITPGR